MAVSFLSFSLDESIPSFHDPAAITSEMEDKPKRRERKREGERERERIFESGS